MNNEARQVKRKCPAFEEPISGGKVEGDNRSIELLVVAELQDVAQVELRSDRQRPEVIVGEITQRRVAVDETRSCDESRYQPCRRRSRDPS
jgi:hypothetical protein